MTCSNTSTQCGVVSTAPVIKRDSRGRTYAELHLRFVSCDDDVIHSSIANGGFEVKPAEFFANYSLNQSKQTALKEPEAKSALYQDTVVSVAPVEAASTAAAADAAVFAAAAAQDACMGAPVVDERYAEMVDDADRLQGMYSNYLQGKLVLPLDLQQKLYKAMLLNDVLSQDQRRPHIETNAKYSLDDIIPASFAAPAPRLSSARRDATAPAPKAIATKAQRAVAQAHACGAASAARAAASSGRAVASEVDKLSYITFLSELKDALSSIAPSLTAIGGLGYALRFASLVKSVDREISKCRYSVDHSTARELMAAHSGLEQAMDEVIHCEPGQVLTDRYLRYYGNREELNRLRNVLSALLPCQVVALCKLQNADPLKQEPKDSPFHDAVVNVIVKLYLRANGHCTTATHATAPAEAIPPAIVPAEAIASATAAVLPEASFPAATAQAETAHTAASSDTAAASVAMAQDESVGAAKSDVSDAQVNVGMQALLDLPLNPAPSPCTSALDGDEVGGVGTLLKSHSSNRLKSTPKSINVDCGAHNLAMQIEGFDRKNSLTDTNAQDAIGSSHQNLFEKWDRVGKILRDEKKFEKVDATDSHQALEHTAATKSAQSKGEGYIFCDSQALASKTIKSPAAPVEAASSAPTSATSLSEAPAAAQALDSASSTSTAQATDGASLAEASRAAAGIQTKERAAATAAATSEAKESSEVMAKENTLILADSLKPALMELFKEAFREPPVDPSAFQESLDSIVDSEAILSASAQSGCDSSASVVLSAEAESALAKRLQSIGLTPKPLKSCLIGHIHRQMANEDASSSSVVTTPPQPS